MSKKTGSYLNYKSRLGQLVKVYMARTGTTLRAIAGALEIRPATVSENLLRPNPRSDFIDRLAELLGYTKDSLRVWAFVDPRFPRQSVPPTRFIAPEIRDRRRRQK